MKEKMPLFSISERIDNLVNKHGWSEQLIIELEKIKEEKTRDLEDKLKILKSYALLISNLTPNRRIFAAFHDPIQKIDALYEECESIERDLKYLDRELESYRRRVME